MKNWWKTVTIPRWLNQHLDLTWIKYQVWLRRRRSLEFPVGFRVWKSIDSSRRLSHISLRPTTTSNSCLTIDPPTSSRRLALTIAKIHQLTKISGKFFWISKLCNCIRRVCQANPRVRIYLNARTASFVLRAFTRVSWRGKEATSRSSINTSPAFALNFGLEILIRIAQRTATVTSGLCWVEA